MKKLVKLLSFLFISLPFFSFSQAQTAKTKHTFVLVHGAWHGSWCWFKIEDLLKREGHKVINVNLPGHSIDVTYKKTITMADYREAVINAIDTLEEKVILVGHSMGGAVISEAGEHRPDKIDRLIYLAAFLLRNGESVLDHANADPYSYVPYSIDVMPSSNLVDIDKSFTSLENAFYNTSDSSYTWLASNLLVENPLIPLATKISITGAYNSIPRFYIKTTEDQAINPQAQKEMVDSIGKCEIYGIVADHSPFFSDPVGLKNILIEIAAVDTSKEKNKVEDDEIITIEDFDFSILFNKLFFEKLPPRAKEIFIDLYSLSGQHLSTAKCSAAIGNSVKIDTAGERNVIVRLRTDTGEVVERKLMFVNR